MDFFFRLPLSINYTFFFNHGYATLHQYHRYTESGKKFEYFIGSNYQILVAG